MMSSVPQLFDLNSLFFLYIKGIYHTLLVILRQMKSALIPACIYFCLSAVIVCCYVTFASIFSEHVSCIRTFIRFLLQRKVSDSSAKR